MCLDAGQILVEPDQWMHLVELKLSCMKNISLCISPSESPYDIALHRGY